MMEFISSFSGIPFGLRGIMALCKEREKKKMDRNEAVSPADMTSSILLLCLRASIQIPTTSPYLTINSSFSSACPSQSQQISKLETPKIVTFEKLTMNPQ